MKNKKLLDVCVLRAAPIDMRTVKLKTEIEAENKRTPAQQRALEELYQENLKKEIEKEKHE